MSKHVTALRSRSAHIACPVNGVWKRLINMQYYSPVIPSLYRPTCPVTTVRLLALGEQATVKPEWGNNRLTKQLWNKMFPVHLEKFNTSLKLINTLRRTEMSCAWTGWSVPGIYRTVGSKSSGSCHVYPAVQGKWGLYYFVGYSMIQTAHRSSENSMLFLLRIIRDNHCCETRSSYLARCSSDVSLSNKLVKSYVHVTWGYILQIYENNGFVSQKKPLRWVLDFQVTGSPYTNWCKWRLKQYGIIHKKYQQGFVRQVQWHYTF